ncbi:hypothetical protein REPUB_Repub04eG0147700 [Reevesia pubescens]
MVARNHEGNVCFSAFQKADLVRDSLMEEMLANKFGLEVAFDNNFKMLEVESDCLQASSEIKKQGDSFWEGAGIINDV